MKRILCITLLITLMLVPVYAQQSPSEWGPEDERGAANRLTPAKVLEATKLIKTGKVYQLGKVYEHGIPLFGSRHYSLTIVGNPSGGPLGENKLVWYDEMFSGEIGQIGTQFDGLGHIGTRVGNEDVYYNGFKSSNFSKPYGLEKLGVEKAGSFFTRGVLIDIAGYKGVERLEVGYVITVADTEGALKKQNVSVGEGDVVIFRTGHGTLWMKDNETFNKGQPGIGMAVGQWLVNKKIVMVAGDTWGLEVVPGEDASLAFPVHQLLIAQHGIYILENLDLEELAKDQVYEFAFVFSPLRLKGGTGSPGNPIAVK